MTELRADESYRVALPEFEGPLDLLLHLCKTHEIEIVNIPIAFITEKYLEYLDVMQSLPVDIAADYLVMAATLAYLKSRELVPTPEAVEAAEEEGAEEVLDPREELIRRLLEYQKYKNAAALLGDRPIEGRNIFGRGMEIDGDSGPAPLADHSAWKLIEAFGKLLEKAGPKVTHEVLFDRVSISARINQVIDRLEQKGGALRFDELFDLKLPELELRSQLVVTLLAMLELARLRVVRVLASEDGETLIIAQVEGAALDEARRAQLSSDAEAVASFDAVAASEGEGQADLVGEPLDAPSVDVDIGGDADGEPDGLAERHRADAAALAPEGEPPAAALAPEGEAPAALAPEGEPPAAALAPEGEAPAVATDVGAPALETDGAASAADAPALETDDADAPALEAGSGVATDAPAADPASEESHEEA